MCAGHRGQKPSGTERRSSGLVGRDSIEEHMEIYEKQGMSRKDAMKQVAKDRGVSKRDIYSYLMK